MSDMLKVAVITGGHDFDVPGFTQLWRTLPGVDAYIQDLTNFAADLCDCRDDYDVLVFFNMPRDVPEGRIRETLERVGQSKQGIVLLHHGILAHEPWLMWRDVAGLHFSWDGFGYSHGEQMDIHVEDGEHPITRGLSDWTITDETYQTSDADADVHLLLTTDHPECMRTIAWTKEYGQARVFSLELGHDNEAWVNESFRTVLLRGMLWAVRKL